MTDFTTNPERNTQKTEPKRRATELDYWLSGEIEITPAERERYLAERKRLEADQPDLFSAAQADAPENEQTPIKRLAERNIGDRTRLIFGIRLEGDHLVYPTPKGGERRKRVEGEGAKYLTPSKPEGDSLYYAPSYSPDAIKAEGVCILAAGEPDTWALAEAGIYHAVSVYGESGIPDELPQQLSRWGVMRVYVFPDLDETGETWRQKVVDTLTPYGIDVDVRQLPERLGEHGDIGEYWRQYTGALPFERELLSLPRLELTPSKPTERPEKPVDQGDVSQGYRDLVAAALGAEWTGEKPFSKNLNCIFHDDQHASASLHDTNGLWCWTCGRWYTWTKTGKAAGVGTLLEWQLKNIEPPKPQLTTETRYKLLQAGLTKAARLLDALYYHGITPATPFTAKQAHELTGLSLWTVYQSIAEAETPPAPVFFGILSTFLITAYTIDKKQKNKSGKGRKAKMYQVISPREAAELVGAVKEWQHFDQVDSGDPLAVKEYRAEVYAALPRRRPAHYARKTLAGKVGVSPRTALRYDEIAGIEATPSYKREELTPEQVQELPEKRRQAPGNVWLEDERGARYEPTKSGLLAAAERGAERVYRVEQGANYYKPAEVQE